jgi:hypothetical protein
VNDECHVFCEGCGARLARKPSILFTRARRPFALRQVWVRLPFDRAPRLARQSARPGVQTQTRGVQQLLTEREQRATQTVNL